LELREWVRFRPGGRVCYEAATKKLLKVYNLRHDPAKQQQILIWITSSACDDALERIASTWNNASHYSFYCIELGHESDDFGAFQLRQCNLQRSPLDTHAFASVLGETIALALNTSTSTRIGSGGTVVGDDSAFKVLDWTMLVVASAHMWNTTTNQLCHLVDRRCQTCYRTVANNKLIVRQDHFKCATCQSCYYCADCVKQFTWHLGSKECAEFVSKSQSAQLHRASIPSYHVAVERGVSAGRAAFDGKKLQFLNDENKRNPLDICDMVCKDIHSINSLSGAMQLQCRSLAIAANVAAAFNSAVDSIAPRLKGAAKPTRIVIS
jgi:hypothetical protein